MTALSERALPAWRFDAAAARPAQLKEQAQALAIVREVIAGNREAFRWVVETYQSSVYNLALRLLGDPAEAEDVTQETLVRAYLHLGSYQAEYRFRAWLLSIAAHLCIDRLRRRKHEPALLEDTPASGEETETENRRALIDPAPLPHGARPGGDPRLCGHVGVDPRGAGAGAPLCVCDRSRLGRFGSFTGRAANACFDLKGTGWALAVQVGLGALVLAVLGNTPFIGGLIGFLAASLGLGALILTRLGTQAYAAAAPAAPSSTSNTPTSA